MGKIGTGELLVILVVALIIFGPSRLPALGKMVGKALGTMKHYVNSDNWEEFADVLDDDADDEDDDDVPPAKAKKKTAAKKSKPVTKDADDEDASETDEDTAEASDQEEAAS